jgi:hypothetical protein
MGGPVAGTYWATVAPVTAEVVGLKELPAALSITWVAITFPTLCRSEKWFERGTVLLTIMAQSPNPSDCKSLPKIMAIISVLSCKSYGLLLGVTVY